MASGILRDHEALLSMGFLVHENHDSFILARVPKGIPRWLGALPVQDSGWFSRQPYSSHAENFGSWTSSTAVHFPILIPAVYGLPGHGLRLSCHAGCDSLTQPQPQLIDSPCLGRSKLNSLDRSLARAAMSAIETKFRRQTRLSFTPGLAWRRTLFRVAG